MRYMLLCPALVWIIMETTFCKKPYKRNTHAQSPSPLESQKESDLER